MKHSKKGKPPWRLLTVLLGVTLAIGAGTSCSIDTGQDDTPKPQNTKKTTQTTEDDSVQIGLCFVCS